MVGTRGARTLGEFVREEQILEWLAGEVRAINAHSTEGARKAARAGKRVLQCTTCTTAACCSSFVLARLFEGLMIAAYLIDTGRDSPALREDLRTRHVAMQATGLAAWNTPCLFLDERKRCAVYEVRPTNCGGHYVYTPPALCAIRSPEILAYVSDHEVVAANQVEEAFREKLALRKKAGRRYLGHLSHMVLIALEAWDRTDFRDHLRQLPWPTEDEVAAWGRR